MVYSEGDAYVADTLLYQYSTAQYLLSRMQEADEIWDKVTPGVLMRLGRKYGPPVVLSALQSLRESLPKVRVPVAYLTSVCVALSAQNEVSTI